MWMNNCFTRLILMTANIINSYANGFLSGFKKKKLKKIKKN